MIVASARLSPFIVQSKEWIKCHHAGKIDVVSDDHDVTSVKVRSQ